MSLGMDFEVSKVLSDQAHCHYLFAWNLWIRCELSSIAPVPYLPEGHMLPTMMFMDLSSEIIRESPVKISYYNGICKPQQNSN